MPRPAANARKSARSHPITTAPVSRAKTAKAAAKKSDGARSATPAAKGNGSAQTSGRPGSPKGRGTDRRASEKIVQGGRMTAGPDTAPGASRGKYVYCIIESGDPLRFGPIGIGADPADVYSVHYKNLAAVVSDAPLEVLDSTRENVLAHERVNETVMHEHTVIPMSFGTIFKTREDIVELLRSAAEAFGDVLNKMQNKLEFGLKVLWDRKKQWRGWRKERGKRRGEEGGCQTKGRGCYGGRMGWGLCWAVPGGPGAESQAPSDSSGCRAPQAA